MTDDSDAKPITNTLVYKDVAEGDSSDNEEIEKTGGEGQDEDNSDYDDEMASSDGDDEGASEEEIKEIPLKKLAAKSMKQAKRARKGAKS